MTDCTFPEFVWIWNRLQGRDLPLLHRRICDWLDLCWRRQERRLLLQAFRAAGKSTLVGLFCAWLLRVDPNLRILVLAAEQDLAGRMVRNVKRIIERHPLTAGLKPERIDQWASDRFTVRRPLEQRDPSMLARGIGANLTGSRADVIICDDVEVPNTCASVAKRVELRTRLGEVDYVLTPDGTILFVGTPHSHYTIYAAEVRPESGEETPFLDGYHRLTIPILSESGESAWPERFDHRKIDQLRRRHGEAKFQSQMMLCPTNSTEARLDPDRMRVYDGPSELIDRNGETVLMLDGVRMVSASAWWDPAYGASTRTDSSVVACVYTGEDGRYRLHRVQYLHVDPQAALDEARQQCRAVARFIRRNHLPSVTIETNGIGRFLPGLLRRALDEAQLACAVLEHHSRENKDTRILAAFDVVLSAGQIACHRSVLATPFPLEMREWRPGLTNRDDGLDAVAGCLTAEPVRLPRTPAMHARQRWRGSGSITAVTDFDV